MPNEEDRTPTLGEVILEAIDGAMLDMHTAIPCVVNSYDVDEVSVNCTPVVHRVLLTDDGDKVSEELPQLQDVPVCFPRGGGTSITWPIAAGDYVMVVFAESNIGPWLATGNAGDPGDITRHSLAGAMAIPCGPYPTPNGEANEDSLTLTADEIRLGSAAATEFVSRADKAQTEMDILENAISTLASLTGQSATINPILAAYTGDTACDKVKAE